MHHLMTWFILCCVLGAMPAYSEDYETVKFDSLPDPVKKTALTFFEIKGIDQVTRINDEGHIRFKIESDKTFNKKGFIAKEIELANNGKIMKLTREVPYFALSFDLMKAIEKRYPEIKVDEVESVQYHYFDVTGRYDGQKLLFRIFEDGLIEEIQAPSP